MNRTTIWAAVALLFGTAAFQGSASAQVVADSACPKYAVDIESFATCDGDRVARAKPAPLATVPALAQLTAAPQVVDDSACVKHAVDIAGFATCDGDVVAGHEVRLIAARTAFDLKQTHGTDVLLIDVRSTAEVEADGTASDVSAVLPYPRQGGAAADLHFVPFVDLLVATHGGNEHTTLVLLCADGVLATRAAASLAEAGYRQLAVVEGGIDGVATASKKVGWKAAQLPWTRQLDARRLYPYAG